MTNELSVLIIRVQNIYMKRVLTVFALISGGLMVTSLLASTLDM